MGLLSFLKALMKKEDRVLSEEEELDLIYPKDELDYLDRVLTKEEEEFEDLEDFD